MFLVLKHNPVWVRFFSHIHVIPHPAILTPTLHRNREGFFPGEILVFTMNHASETFHLCNMNSPKNNFQTQLQPDYDANGLSATGMARSTKSLFFNSRIIPALTFALNF
jgi:hypothetical protein